MDIAGIWLDAFCSSCHKEMTLPVDQKSGHFCKRCYAVAYCSSYCRTIHSKQHSVLCNFVRRKYSIVVDVSRQYHLLLAQRDESHYTRNSSHFEQSLRKQASSSRFIVRICSSEHNPSLNQTLQLYNESGEVITTFECADLFPVITECGIIVFGFCTRKEISCWAYWEEEQRRIWVFYHELPPQRNVLESNRTLL